MNANEHRGDALSASHAPTSTTRGGDSGAEVARPPHEPLPKLFRRFLGFGLLAWGGPVAQIGMIQKELVDEERWISREEFRRALAVYQVLPGPEAHELCVFFGMRARGRIGGILAGLGFMLPGFALMLGLTWLYLEHGLGTPRLQAAFGAVQAAVCALVVRATVRIGSHALADRWLWSVAILSALAEVAGLHFAVPLVAGGILYSLARAQRRVLATAAAALVLAAAVFVAAGRGASAGGDAAPVAALAAPTDEPGLPALAWSGLRSGLLTFGGAYTVIPFLRDDATVRGGWMTDEQFLDGLALSGILPAPLIIFATFVGYLGGGPLGAVVMTIAIFAPAFAFTLLGHDYFDRLVHRPRLRSFLDGVTAAVVGLIGATAISLLLAAVDGIAELAVFAIAVAALFRWSHKLVVPLVVAGAAVAGILLSL